MDNQGDDLALAAVYELRTALRILAAAAQVAVEQADRLLDDVESGTDRG